DGGANELVAFSSVRSGTPKGGAASTNDVNLQFLAPFSGRVRVLLNQRDCAATTLSGISLFTRVNGGSNTLDDQNAEGTNSWMAHVYDGVNKSVNYNGTFTSYLGYNTVAEQFDELFGGADV